MEPSGEMEQNEILDGDDNDGNDFVGEEDLWGTSLTRRELSKNQLSERLKDSFFSLPKGLYRGQLERQVSRTVLPQSTYLYFATCCDHFAERLIADPYCYDC